MYRIPRSLRALIATLLGIGLIFTLVSSASAHAKVNGSTPKMNTTIAQAPTTITVTTLEDMKAGAQYSNLFVYGPSGDLVSQGNATISLNNARQMSITIKPEKGDGVYIVRWVTVSNDDGDPDQGAFTFTVKSSISSTPVPTTTAAASTGTPPWVALVVGIVALLVGLLAGFMLGANRQRK